MLAADQEAVFTAWAETLDMDFDLQRLQRHQYASEPWAQLRSIFTQVDGVASFGFRKAARRPGQSKEGVFPMSPISPWIHIETAMAIALRVPVLAIAEESISDGVFAPDVWSESLYGVPTGTAPSRDVIPEQWIEAVHRSSTARRS